MGPRPSPVGAGDVPGARPPGDGCPRAGRVTIDGIAATVDRAPGRRADNSNPGRAQGRDPGRGNRSRTGGGLWPPPPTVGLAGRRVPSFVLSGVAGLALALPLTQALTAARHLPATVNLLVALVAVLSLVVLVELSALRHGQPDLAAYTHLAGALASAAVLLAALGRPLLLHLDVMVVGLATFQACGRIGCLAAGCCHGRPARLGVRYGQDHVAHGFPGHLAGVRLWPVPLVEAGALAALVVAATVAHLAGVAPGTVLGGYLVTYATVRLLLEPWRGDLRPRAWPWPPWLTGPQVASMLVLLGVTAAAASGHLPGGVGLPAAMIALAAAGWWSVRRQRRDLHALLAPRHVQALAEAVDGLPPPAATPGPAATAVATTPLGVRISTGRVDTPGGPATHYAISRTPPLGDREAHALATLVARLRHPDPDGPVEVVQGNHAVTHLLVPASR